MGVKREAKEVADGHSNLCVLNLAETYGGTVVGGKASAKERYVIVGVVTEGSAEGVGGGTASSRSATLAVRMMRVDSLASDLAFFVTLLDSVAFSAAKASSCRRFAAS